MKIPGLWFSLSVWLLATFVLPAANETNEPVLLYTLSLNGQKQTLTNDRPQTLSGTFTNPEVRIVASPVRTFAYAGLRFDYPAHFLWDVDVEEPAAKIWFMSGDDFIFQVHLMEAPMTAREFATDMCLNMDYPKNTLRPTTRKLGGQTFRGYRFTDDAGPDEDGNVIEVLDVSSPSKIRFLLLMDLQTDGKTTEEGKKALRLLEQTFQITVPPKN